MTRRRTVVLGGLGIGALAIFGWPKAWRPWGRPLVDAPPAELVPPLIAFLGTLFGREPSVGDTRALAQRLNLLISDGALHHQCEVLVRHLESEAKSEGAASFAACSASRKERIVEGLMAIEPQSGWARLSAKLSQQRQDFYLMREWTVPALAWLYRNSAAAWRARGYSRWPGVPGDWHEILTRGPPYP